MTNSQLTPGIAAGRLSADDYCRNFADIAPRLDAHEARLSQTTMLNGDSILFALPLLGATVAGARKVYCPH